MSDTTADVTLPAAVAGPDQVGQATAVEQSRAVAEVQAAIIVAQRCPRSVPAAVDAMREACRHRAVAERAFFRFPRGTTTVAGETVYLARELARTWGNIQYGISELRRDDGRGESEIMAYAWDVQTNTRVSNTFVVPHMRDKRGGPERLTDLRDVYENNSNQGSRRVRECIFSVLPKWFTDEAKELCHKTLVDGGGEPLGRRAANALTRFAELGISADRVERRLGKPRGRWDDIDLANLTVTYQSIKRGELAAEDEFPPERLSVADLPPAEAGPAAADAAGE